MGERREELLQKCMVYFLEKGLADLSLRPLAEGVGTSARMLMYHFGSKEGLVTAVMGKVQRQFQNTFTGMMAPGAGEEPVLLQFWKELSRPANLPYLRLAFEVQVLALQRPGDYGRYLEQVAIHWQDLVERALPLSPDRRAMATLCSAVFDGLILTLLTTGDLDAATESIRLFAELLAADPAQRARIPRPGRDGTFPLTPPG